MYRVYVLQNCHGKRYIGISINVTKRLSDHNQGRSTYTRGKGPWHLVWQSTEFTLSDARKVEEKLKRQKGGAGLAKLLTIHCAMIGRPI